LSVDLPAGGGVPPTKQEQLKVPQPQPMPTKQEQLREQPFLYVSDVKSLPRPEEALPFQQQHYALVPQHEELPSVAYWGKSLEERLVAMSTARYEMASHQTNSLPSAMSSYRSTKSKCDERTPGKEWTFQTAKKNPPHQIGWQPFDSRQTLIGLSVLLPIPPSGREAKALNKQEARKLELRRRELGWDTTIRRDTPSTMRGVRPITTEPWADDAIRFTDLTVEKRGDHTDAGEREMLKVIQHLREHGCAPPDIQTKLYEESAEYQSALAYIRKERLAKHGAFGLTGTREDRFDALRDSLMC